MAEPVIPVCAVSINVFGQDGVPQAGARVTAQLNSFEIYNGYVVPQRIEGETDANGLCVLSLFPNELGSVESHYKVKILGVNGKSVTITAVVPNVTTANLENIAVLPAFPGKVDGQLALEAVLLVGEQAQQAAIDAQNAAVNASSSESNAMASALAAVNAEAASFAHESAASASADSASGSASAASASAAAASASASAASASAAEAAAQVSSLSPGTMVRTTGDQVVSGVKTFNSSPVVPAGASGAQAPRAQDVPALAAASMTTAYRNKVINGSFEVNQDGVGGTVTLAAGLWGHDMWKAGASGCTYTFATSAGVTTLTISAGSLVQVIEGALLRTGTHVMSWTGTAQGKIGAGSFSASGVTGSVTGGANLTVEFGTGTLSNVQLEPGTVMTPFEYRMNELQLCQRYFWRGLPAGALNMQSYANGAIISFPVMFPVTMRATPTLMSNFTGATLFNVTGLIWDAPTAHGGRLLWTCTGININTYVTFAAENVLVASARL